MSGDNKLFEHLNFLIVAKVEQLESARSIIDILKRNSCQLCSIYKCTDNRIPDGDLKSWFMNDIAGHNTIHFIISEDIDFPFYRVASIDFLIPVVTPAWIYNCIETKKHVRTSIFSPDPKHIFREFQIYVSRHSFNNSEYLFYTEMVHALGGTCVDFLSNKTTHLVTNDPHDPGILAVRNFGQANTMKFVYATWIVECFKRISLASEHMHRISPDDSDSSSKGKLDDIWCRINEIDFKSTSTVWNKHSFIIGMDISLSRELYCTLIEFLQANGGTVHRHLDESDIARTSADCYIGKLISSGEYEVAKDKELHLGNLIWVFYMWSLGKFVSPTKKLLFSPFKRKVVETNRLIATYTNFFGQQRFYIQRLVNALGGFTTPDFSRKNTHLLSRFPIGKKFEMAKKWQDKCVITNHLWLEECYRQSTSLDPLEQPFQEIPVKGGLEKTLGQMQWDDAEFSEDLDQQCNIENFDTQESPLMSQDHKENMEIKENGLRTPGLLTEEPTVTDEQNESKVNDENLSPLVQTIDQPLKTESNTKDSKRIESQIQSERSEQVQARVERTPSCEDASRQDIHNSREKKFCINTSNVQSTTSDLRDNTINLKRNHEQSHDVTKSQKGARTITTQINTDQEARAEQQQQQVPQNPEEVPSAAVEKLQKHKSSIERGNLEKISKDKLEDSNERPHQYLQEQNIVKEQDQNFEINGGPDITQQPPSEYSGESLVFSKQTVEDASQPARGAPDPLKSKSPSSGKAEETNSHTPSFELTPKSVDHFPSSQGSRRAAKDKAARKLHDDIESLNEFQRNSKRKKTGSLLPEEIVILEKRRTLEIKAKELLLNVQFGKNENTDKHGEFSNDTESHCIQNHLPKKLYHIDALLTGIAENLDELDLTILRLLGITIHKEITSENFEKLDTIIAPKKLRTAKFLKSLSFHPLKYALTPKFLKDILKIAHKGKKSNLALDLSHYYIPDTSHEKFFQLTSLPDKVFERAGILKVNIASDIPGGIDTISSILKVHGVKGIKSIQTKHMNSLSINDFLLNDMGVEYRTNSPWEYIFLVNKPSQVRFFKKLVKSRSNSALAVAWDWFVAGIFRLEVDFSASDHVIYRTDDP